MRDRMERFVILPFSVGCVSDSSVAVALQQQPNRKSKPVPAAPVPVPADTANSTATSRTIREDEEEGLSGENMKYSLKFLPLPKPDISNGFHRLCKSFKTFSQLFADKEEMESEKDMEIGLPTDVKHVTHIGLDGSTSSSPNSSWESIFSQELFTFPCVPQGLPMETQAAAAASPLVQAST